MTRRISEPLSWYGREVEALLVTENGSETYKELVTVTRIREGEAPEAFFRVKVKGEESVEFTNWLEAVDYYNCIESNI